MARPTASAAFVLAVLLAGVEARAQGWMHWPVERGTAPRTPITQGYYGDYLSYCGGREACGTHNAYDVAMGVGTALYAVAPGVVDAVNVNDVRTADYGNAGRWVRVRHDGSTVPGLGATYYVSYLHLSRVDVSPGDRVTTTTRVALSGNSGGVGAHLHLHLGTAPNYCGGPVDPGCPTPAYVRGSVVPSGFVDAPGCQSVCRGVTIQWIQPAAYGNEAYARVAGPECGALDYRGRCEGETLRWCMDGTPMEAECLGRGGVCAWQNDSEGFNCLRCDPASGRALLPGPRCEGSRYVRCDGTRPVSEDCASGGRTCTPTGCVAPMPTVDAGVTIDAGAPIEEDAGAANDLGGRDVRASEDVADAAADDSSTLGIDSGLNGGDLRGDCGCRTVGASQAGHRLVALAGLLGVIRRRRRR